MKKSIILTALGVAALAVTTYTVFAGTGACTESGCGCKAFSAASGFPDHCIGKNSAGGTCNHLKDKHK